MQHLLFDAKTNKIKEINPPADAAAADAAAAAAAAAAADPLLLPIHLKKILCTVLRCNTRAMAFYKERCLYTSDESCPYWLQQQDLQQQQLTAGAGGSSSDEEGESEYEILKRELKL